MPLLTTIVYKTVTHTVVTTRFSPDTSLGRHTEFARGVPSVTHVCELVRSPTKVSIVRL